MPGRAVSWTACLRSSEGVKPFVGISDEWQAHLCRDIIASLRRLGAEGSTIIVLVDLVNGEILRIDVGLELRFEGSADTT